MIPSLCITSLRLEHLGKVLFLSGERLPTNQAADYVEKELSALPNWKCPSCRWTMREKGNTEQQEIKIWGKSNVKDVKGVFISCSVLSDFSLMTEQGIGWIPLWKHILIALTQDTSRIPNPTGPCLAVCLAGSQNSFINSTELFHSLLKLNFH